MKTVFVLVADGDEEFAGFVEAGDEGPGAGNRELEVEVAGEAVGEKSPVLVRAPCIQLTIHFHDLTIGFCGARRQPFLVTVMTKFVRIL